MKKVVPAKTEKMMTCSNTTANHKIGFKTNYSFSKKIHNLNIQNGQSEKQPQTKNQQQNTQANPSIK
ncbi:MAG: hypothetical protein JXR39_11250 [Marinilabiliaceae bacterium]|nr:hypothetical protein [Marinilabiliaceae bacterium]